MSRHTLPTCVWAVLLGLLLCIGCKSKRSEFYVAPDGRDDRGGTIDEPFATLERARTAIRDLRRNGGLPRGGVTVYLRGGLHSRMDSFELTREDSGTEDSPVVYRPYADEVVRISAGTSVPNSAFKPVTDGALLARIDPSARDKVLQLDLTPLGITHAGPFPHVFADGGGIFELFFNHQRMPLSRWPNEGYTTIERVIEKGDTSTKSPQRRSGTFVYRGDRPSRWSAENGVWLSGFWHVPWQQYSLLVKSIDTENKQITFADPCPGSIGAKGAGAKGSGKEPWYAINLLEEIDRPGEWAVDFKAKTLYFWPPATLENAKVLISDRTAPIIHLLDASHVLIRSLIFECSLGNGVEIEGGENNLIAGCTFRNLGGTGVVIASGKSNGVQSSDFYDLGHCGIALTGGDPKTLTPAGNYAVNNEIHHVGILKKTYAPGILLGAYDMPRGVGNRVSCNRIYDLPHAGIIYSGNDNSLEYNEVYRVGLDSNDVGAFYTWHDWTSRGNHLRYNFVHHSPNVNAFYLDDGDSGDTLFGNVVVDASSGPFIGGGRDNIVQNNLIIAARHAAIHLDARGVTRNYNATNKQMVNALNAVNYKQPPWSERYPEMLNILEFHPELPAGNVIETNLIVHSKNGVDFSGKPEHLAYVLAHQNIELTDEEADYPALVSGNLNLKDDSAVYKRFPAFKPIPIEKIGLYRDEFRTQVPSRPWDAIVDQPAEPDVSIPNDLPQK